MEGGERREGGGVVMNRDCLEKVVKSLFCEMFSDEGQIRGT